MIYYAQKLSDPVTFKNVMAPVIDIYRRIPAGVGNYKSDMLDQINDLINFKESQLASQPGDTNLTDQIKWLKDQIK
jgi:hypothetical protein